MIRTGSHEVNQDAPTIPIPKDINEALPSITDEGPKKLSEFRRQIAEGTINAHIWFDRKERIDAFEKPSFHNEKHIKATIKGATKFLETALDGGEDPFKILEDLARWNRENPTHYIDKKELLDLVLVAMYFHDTGNTAELDDNGVLKTRETYSAEGAEEHSKKIAAHIIKTSKLLDEDQKTRYVPFIEHLIEQTVFSPDGPVHPDATFGHFIPFVDQIGNDLVNEDDTRIYGLLAEIGNDVQINPFKFFNFAHTRMDALLPEGAKAETVVGILGEKAKERYERVTDAPDKVMSVGEFLAQKT